MNSHIFILYEGCGPLENSNSPGPYDLAVPKFPSNRHWSVSSLYFHESCRHHVSFNHRHKRLNKSVSWIRCCQKGIHDIFILDNIIINKVWQNSRRKHTDNLMVLSAHHDTALINSSLASKNDFLISTSLQLSTVIASGTFPGDNNSLHHIHQFLKSDSRRS